MCAWTEGCSWCWEELGLPLKRAQLWGRTMQLFNSTQKCFAASTPDPYAKGEQLEKSKSPRRTELSFTSHEPLDHSRDQDLFQVA